MFIVLGGKILAQLRCVEGAIMELDHMHCNQVPCQALQEEGIDASLRPQALGANPGLARIS